MTSINSKIKFKYFVIIIFNMTEGWSSKEFKIKLTGLRDANHLKNHPYFDLWSLGKLSKKDMAQYILQHRLWSSQIVNLWGIVVAKSNNTIVQDFFLENMAEEHGIVSEDGRTSTPHVEMQIAFARACGMSEKEIKETEPTAGCLAMISYHWYIALAKTWQEYVAASVVANESMEVGIMGRIVPALHSHYGYKEGDMKIEFFEEHYLADQEHGERGISALADNTPELNIQQNCIKAVREAIKIRTLFLDELYQKVIKN